MVETWCVHWRYKMVQEITLWCGFIESCTGISVQITINTNPAMLFCIYQSETLFPYIFMFIKFFILF